MLVGLTYDLRADYLAAGYGEEQTAEFDRPDTIQAIDAALRQLGHETEQIGNARQLVGRLAAGGCWDLVFNIAEGLHGIGREAQVPAILDVYQIPYTFSDPLVLALALHKGLTKVVVRSAGIPTPDFALVERPEDADRVDLPLPLFAKPLAEGTGKGITAASKIRQRAALRPICGELLARYSQPVLVETFLPGREFTVGVLGTGADARVLASMEVLLLPGAEADVYSYANKEQSEEHCQYRLGRADEDAEVRRAEQLALAAYRALGCRDAGRVDLRSDAQGQPNFLEINPLAGLHPQHSDLPILAGMVGVSYRELIERIVRSAAQRVQQRQAAAG
jgi:D-alanine-D-alanine ligase